MNSLLEPSNILRGFVSYPGNGIAIADQRAPRIRQRRTVFFLEEPESTAWLRGQRRRFAQLNDLAFNDAPDLIQMGAPLPFDFFRVGGMSAPPVESGARTYGCGRSGPQQNPPIDSCLSQRPRLPAVAAWTMSPSASRAFSQSFKNPSSPRSVSRSEERRVGKEWRTRQDED